MMKLIITIILSFLGLFVLGQNFRLNWSSPKSVFTFEEQQRILPTFQDENFYVGRDALPRFNYSEKVDKMYSVSIENVQYSNVPKNQLGEISIHEIPKELVYKARVLKARDIYTLSVDILPFINDNGMIKRVESFNIRKDNYINRLSNATNISGNSARVALSQNNGDFYKISVDTTGVYRIGYDFFVENNIPTDFNPSQMKLLGNGGLMLPENPGEFVYDGLQETAIKMMAGDDSSFDSGDYFLFYAQGPNGTKRNLETTLSNAEHLKHLYEDKAYYFINIGSGGFGKRIGVSNVSGSPTEIFNTTDEVVFYEKDSVNIDNVGRQWFGERFNLENTQSFSLPGYGSIQGDIMAEARFVGVLAQGVNASVSVGGGNVGTANFTGQANDGNFEPRSIQNTINSSYPLNATVSVDDSSNPSGSIYLDYIELKFQRSLNFSSQGQFLFRKFQNLNDGDVYGFSVGGSPQYVWNVSDRTNTVEVNPVGGNYLYSSFSPNFPNEFVAFNESQAYSPEFVEKTASQNIANLQGVQYVIVTHPMFKAQAQLIANYHQNNSFVNTAVVTTEEVYNQFGSGSQDISAIRNFFKYLYEQPNGLKYALLYGDSSYDFKDRIPDNTNFVPAFQSFASYGLSSTFVTDDFFACLDDTDDGEHPVSGQMDIAIGRLPASNLENANVLTQKTLAYQNAATGQSSPFGDWRTKIHFVVDDDDPGAPLAFHTVMDENTLAYMEENYPEYTLRKLYLDSFVQESSAAGPRYPSVNRAITNAIETGTLVLNYFGHGGINGWTQERVFSIDDFENLTNFNSEYTRLPVFVTVTCDFTVWDIPQINSGGETLIKNSEGGASVMITTSREIATAYGTRFNQPLMARLFEYDGIKYKPMGEALRLAKIDYDLGTNGLSVNLLGDPLMRLPRPTRKINIETINGEPANEFNGLIRALDFVTINGNVQNIVGTGIDQNFNGTLSATLFDKAVEKTTRNNDGNLQQLTYTEQVDALYRGKTDVENGEFTLEFYVPKDINFEVGDGKLLLYAENGDTDAISYKNDIQVGDINPDGVDDDKGPEIGLYMNNKNFANGGITNRSPYLLACVVDSTGINATGVGIGHDITELLDDDINSTTVLNEYYEGGDTSPCINPAVKDYQKGRVLYRLRNLELGEHTVTFKVWDVNNNSSAETLDFVVLENGEQKLHINRLLNWPNPFTNKTYFHFEHNCDDVLEVQVQIFTVSGKLIKTIRQTVSSAPFREGYRTDKFGIPWDGLDDFGNKIGKGVYIYRTIVKGSNPETCKGTATETEKLVILK